VPAAHWRFVRRRACELLTEQIGALQSLRPRIYTNPIFDVDGGPGVLVIRKQQVVSSSDPRSRTSRLVQTVRAFACSPSRYGYRAHHA
jgi:hypothetical protein